MSGDSNFVDWLYKFRGSVNSTQNKSLTFARLQSLHSFTSQKQVLHLPKPTLPSSPIGEGVHDATNSFTPCHCPLPFEFRLRRHPIHKPSSWNNFDRWWSYNNNMGRLWSCASSFRPLHLLLVFMC